MLGIEVLTESGSSSTEGIQLSVVVPIYNESANIPVLLERLHQSLSPLGLRYEIICVNDGSFDDSLSLLESIAKKDPYLKIISFSRNFGHQVAITAGTEYASGAAVVVMDADLQDPPEVIPDLVAKWKEGYDVVFAVRKKRLGESKMKLLTAHIFYRLMKKLIKFDIPLDSGDFRLMGRNVVNVYLSMPESQRFIRGMISWIGFKQVGVFYERPERLHGHTKFSYGKMFSFAFDGITGFSYIPLQLASYVGFISAALSFLLIFWTLYSKFIQQEAVRGWTSSVIITLFLGGTQLIMIGLLGEYIGRIHTEQKRRPQYIVAKKINFTSK